MVDFDPAKEIKNVRRHKISLTQFDHMTDRVIRPDVKHSQMEDRFHIIGLIDGGVWVATITYRGGQERVISLRPASRKERKFYGEATQA